MIDWLHDFPYSYKNPNEITVQELTNCINLNKVTGKSSETRREFNIYLEYREQLEEW